MIAADPDDATGVVKVLAPLKPNLSARAPALRFRLVVDPGAEHPRVQWEGVSDRTAETLLAAAANPEEQLARYEAAEFLRCILGDGQWVRTKEVERAAREEGISERTLNRARKRVGVRAEHRGQPGERGEWWLSLPVQPPVGGVAAPNGATKEADPGGVAPFEQVTGASGCAEPEVPKGARTREDGELRVEVAAFDDEVTCPRCGGRVMTFAGTSVCTGCHRPLGAIIRELSAGASQTVEGPDA
jgi:hypothetical protein